MEIRQHTHDGEAGWWITDTPHGIDGPIGPYATKAEAAEDMAGIKRFIRLDNNTSEPARDRLLFT